MSMWEVESLIECAVRLVAGSDGLTPVERRTFYANLYDLQELHDCSYTHFRLPELLMRDGFFHRIDLDEHPAYAEHGPALEKLVEGERDAWIPMDPNEEGYASAGLYDAGLGKPPFTRERGLYFDIRSPLWPPLCASGRLTGLAAEPFDNWSQMTTFARTLALALKSPGELGRDVLHGMYGFAYWCLPWSDEAEREPDPELLGVLAEPVLLARLAQETPDDWIAERFRVPEPSPEDSESTLTFLRWWRRPLDDGCS